MNVKSSEIRATDDADQATQEIREMRYDLHIALVDDTAENALLTLTVLDVVGRQTDVTICPNATTLLAKHRSQPFDVVFLDNSLPDATGLEIIRMLQESGGPLPIIIILSAKSQRELEIIYSEYMQSGIVSAIISKPYDADDLVQTLCEVWTHPIVIHKEP